MVLGVKISVLLLSIRAIMILDIVLSKVVYLSECVFWFVSRLCCLCLLLTRIYFHRLLRRILVAWEWVIRVHHVSLCLR